MRYGWLTIVVMALAVMNNVSKVEAQATNSGQRLKFTPPRTASAPELRPAANAQPLSAPSSAAPSTATSPAAPGSSSLMFRNARPSSTWNETIAPRQSDVPAQFAPPPDVVEVEETAPAEESLAADPVAPAKKKAPAKRSVAPPAELADDEGEEPGVSMEFTRPASTAQRRATVNRDPRVAQAVNRSPYGRAANAKQTAAQVDVPGEVEGPALMPQPDPISSGDWIQPEYSENDWIGPSQPQRGYSGPGRYREMIWVRADYISGWTNGMSLPPLVTTSPDGTPRNIPFAIANVANNALVNPDVVGFKRVPVAGVLGYPNTTVLFGGRRVNDGYRPGGRITLGGWLTCSRMLGIEGDYLGLADQSTRFRAAGTNGTPIIMRPFFNTDVNVNLPDAEVVNFPPTNQPGLEGQVTIDTLSRVQFGGLRFLLNWGCDDGCPDFEGLCGQPVWIDCNLLLGYRWARLDEGVWIQENLRVFADGTDLNAQGLVGTTINVFDSFRTTNQFHGADLGYTTKITHGRWTFDLLSKIALGNTQSIQTIEGQTVVTPVPPGAVQTIENTGLLAQRSNVGRHTSNKFSTIPETGLTIGYNVTPRLRVHAGYSFIYWTNVLRGGDQIDLSVNGQYLNGNANVQGQNRPIYDPNYGHLYVHAINTGIEAKF